MLDKSYAVSPPPPPPPPPPPRPATKSVPSTPSAGVAAMPPPGKDVHTALQQHPEQRDVVYRQLTSTDPGLIHHLETWRQQDEQQAGDGGSRATSLPHTGTNPWEGLPRWTEPTGSRALQFRRTTQAAPIDAGLEDVRSARDKLEKLEVALPPAGSGGPGEAALAAQRAELRDAIQADLERADEQGPSYPGDPLTAEQRVEGRAAVIKALAPGDASFTALVDGVKTQINENRAVDASSAEVQRVYEQDGAVAAARALDRLTAANPEVAGRIVAESSDTIDAITADLGRFDRSDEGAARDVITALGAAAELGGASSIEQVAASIANGAADSDFGAYALGPHGNPAIPTYAGLNGVLGQVIEAGGSTALAVATADALRAGGRTEAAAKVDQAVVNGVDGLRADFEDISAQYAQREIQLQKDLAAFGPALTADEQAAYIEAYWADESTIEAGDDGTLASNAEVRRRVAAGDDQLAAALEAATPTLERLALTGDENADEVMLDAYESLARTPAYAERATDWAQRVENNPALFEKLDGFVDDDLATRLQDGIRADALESMASQLLVNIAAADPSERQGLISTFIDKARLLDSSGAYLDDIEKITQINDDWQEFQRLSALPAGHPDRAKIATFEARLADNAEGLVDGWGDKNGFGKSLAVVGLVVGFADTVESYRSGDLPGAVLAAIGTGKDAAEIGIGMLGVIGKGGRVIGLDAANFGSDAASVARLGAKAADFGARFLPLVGFGLDAVQLTDDIDQLRTNPNFGEGIAAVGTVLALGGDALEVIPLAGTVLGGALGAIGSLIHGVGGFIDGLIEGSDVEDALHARQRSYLEAADLDKESARNLVENHQQVALLENFGMRPEFVRELVNRGASDPTDSEGLLMRLAFDSAAAHGLTGAVAERFIGDVLASPNGADVSWADVGYSNALLGLIDLAQIVDGAGTYNTLDQTRGAQIEWFRQNMPDIYDKYFAPIPGLPSSAQPGNYAGPGNSGYFDDVLALVTGSDPDIAGTEPNER